MKSFLMMGAAIALAALGCSNGGPQDEGVSNGAQEIISNDITLGETWLERKGLALGQFLLPNVSNTLLHLDQRSAYRWNVRSVNAVGDGPWSGYEYFSTY